MRAELGSGKGLAVGPGRLWRQAQGSLAMYFGDSESQQTLILLTNEILIATICYILTMK